MRAVLLSALVLAVVLGTVHLMLPKGLDGLVGKGGDAEAAVTGPPKSDKPPVLTAAGKGVLAAREMEKGYAAFDRGDFNDAVTFFVVATSTAPDDTKRRRATAELGRALLARAAIRGAPPAEPGQYATLAEDAELSGSEQKWFDALRTAAGGGLKRKLAYAFAQLIDYSVKGGPLEQHVEALARAESRPAEANRLYAALQAYGLGPEGGTRPGSDGPYVRHDPWDDEYEDDDDTGGIGSVGNYTPTRIRVPFGRFSPSMRKDLERACKLEGEGKREYDLAAPDQPNRGKHRKAALAKLTEARTIYDAALQEDDNSSALQERYSVVIRLIAGLRRDSTAGD